MEDGIAGRGGEIKGQPPIKEIDVLWITAGLGCDGDTIAITAATQPSIEDIVMGGLPGIPKVNFHNPVLKCSVHGKKSIVPTVSPMSVNA